MAKVIFNINGAFKHEVSAGNFAEGLDISIETEMSPSEENEFSALMAKIIAGNGGYIIRQANDLLMKMVRERGGNISGQFIKPQSH